MRNSLIDVPVLQLKVAVSRDQKAYRELFLHFYKPLIKFAATILPSREAAEEVYSDVMLKLWQLGPALGSVENLRTYLFICTKNAALNYLARHYKVRTVDLDAVEVHLEDSCGGEQDLVQAELKRAAALSVRALPPKCQLVYLLVREYGFSYKDVARTLDISVNTVEGHMTTALKKLAGSLKPYLQPDRN